MSLVNHCSTVGIDPLLLPTTGITLVRPHGLSHAAITHALDVIGGDARRVQKFYRHRVLPTLTVYDDNREDFAGEVAALVAGVA